MFILLYVGANSKHTQTLKVTSLLCGTWQAGTDAPRLFDLSAISPDDIWGVGASGDRAQDLIYHWDGGKWNTISPPEPKDNRLVQLAGIKAITTNDVWAVGNTFENPLTIHWDGKEWSVIPTPKLKDAYLAAVSAVSVNDVWAVGTIIGSKVEVGYDTYTDDSPLALHWDGKQWTVISVPDLGEDGLDQVEAVSTHDVWALNSKTILHWDGSKWTTTFNKSNGAYYNPNLRDLAAITSNNAWVVGSSSTGDTLIMHWDGTDWNYVPSPNPPTQNGLFAVAAISTNDVWTVGDVNTDQWESREKISEWQATGKNLVLHWDGNKWSTIPGPEPTKYQHLRLLTVAGPNEIWAAGRANDEFDDENIGRADPLIASFTRAACPGDGR